MNNKKNTILEAKNLYKIYNSKARELTVLKGVSLDIKEGELLSIVGPSGAGKSTLLHLLGGLDRPTKGSVNFDGTDLYKISDEVRSRLRNRSIGFVFQFYHLLPEFSALENLILPACVGASRQKTKLFFEKGQEYLNLVGLVDRGSHRPSELSGGEQQRLAIARALINDPQIIFCDEPTGNLDSKLGSHVFDLLGELNRKRNKTIVVVTHDENMAKEASRMIRLQDGKLL